MLTGHQPGGYNRFLQKGHLLVLLQYYAHIDIGIATHIPLISWYSDELIDNLF